MAENIRNPHTETGDDSVNPEAEALVAEIDRRFASGESHRYTLEEMRLYMKSERCKRARHVLEELGRRANQKDLPRGRDTAWVSIIPVGF